MDEPEIEETTAPEPVPEKGAKKGFLKIVFLALLVLGLGGAAAYYFYGRTVFAHSQKPKAEEKKQKAEIGPIIALEPFVINVSGSPSRYVKISVAVEVKNEKAVEEAKKITPVIRDTMLTVLGTKTPEAFMDVNARAGMKKELFEGVNRLFADGGLKAVYITDIVMQ